MYAVIGATGNTGRAVVKELKGLGENPICVVRNADKAREVLGGDTKTAVAELDDRLGAPRVPGDHLADRVAHERPVVVDRGQLARVVEIGEQRVEPVARRGIDVVMVGRDDLGPDLDARADRRDLDRTTHFFQKYGSITVLVARLLPVVRTFIALPAGIARSSESCASAGT